MKFAGLQDSRGFSTTPIKPTCIICGRSYLLVGRWVEPSIVELRNMADLFSQFETYGSERSVPSAPARGGSGAFSSSRDLNPFGNEDGSDVVARMNASQREVRLLVY